MKEFITSNLASFILVLTCIAALVVVLTVLWRRKNSKDFKPSDYYDLLPSVCMCLGMSLMSALNIIAGTSISYICIGVLLGFVLGDCLKKGLQAKDKAKEDETLREEDNQKE